MRKALIMLAAVVGSLIVALGVGVVGASAQDDSDVEQVGLQATLTYDDEPVEGVEIEVFTADGDLVDSAASDGDGYWMVAVPEPGEYRAELDEDTLPDGVAVVGGPVREPEVRPSSVGNLLYALEDADAVGEGEEGDSGGETGGPTSEEPDPGADPEADAEVVAGPGPWDRVVSHLYSGFHLGLIVGLAALGLSLVFGTTGLINFSHGELVTFGACAALLVNVVGIGLFGFDLKLHLTLAVPAAAALGVLFGYVQDRFFWGWLRRRGTGLVAMMIISIGVALVLRHLYLYFIGPGRQPYDQYTIQEPLVLGPLTVMPKTLITDAIALVVLVSVAVALLTTRSGKAIRAVADNPALAAASGINVDRIVRLVWSVGTGLAALAGVFLAMHQTVNYLMGFQMLLLIFTAVIVGGLGTAFGAVAGGLIVGVLIQVSTLWVPNEFKYVIALALLIVMLLVRPQGLLGRRARIG